MPTNIFQSLKENRQLDLSGLMAPCLTLTRPVPWIGSGALSEFPAEPLILRPFSLDRTNLSLYLGTPELAERFSKNRPLLNQYNLAHRESLPLRDRFLAYLLPLLQLSGIDTSLTALSGSGSASVQGAIRLAQIFHRDISSGRCGVVCSEAAHRSVRAALDAPVYSVPIHASTGQMDTAILRQVLEEKRPAAIVETVVTTDRAVIEQIPENLNRYCQEQGIFRIKDLTLAAIVPLLNQVPRFSGDTSPEFVRAYAFAVRAGTFDILACGTGKHYGASGIAAILSSDQLNPLMRSSIRRGLAIDEGNGTDCYFASSSVYGTTTLSALPLVMTVRTIEALGKWRLGFLATHAVQTARLLAKELQTQGISVDPVSINSVVVNLVEKTEVKRVADTLRGQYGIDVARVSVAGNGIRLVIPFEHVIEREMLTYIVNAVADSVYSREPLTLNTRPFSSSRRYRVEQAHLKNMKAYCEEGYVSLVTNSAKRSWASPPVLVNPETFEAYDRAQSALAIVAATVDERVDMLSEAFTVLYQALSGKGGWKRVRELAQRFKCEIADIDGNPNEWSQFLSHVADQLSAVARWTFPGLRRGREPLFQKLAEQVIDRCEPMYQQWIESGKLVSRQDRISGVNDLYDSY